MAGPTPAQGEPNRIPSVFISYSRSDSSFVKGLATWLQDAGCTVWQDTSGLRGGEAWSHGIDQAVRGCDVFVIVLSPDSSGSEWVQKETLLAMKLHKPIAPILLRETEIPVQLVDLQFIDFLGNRNEAIQRLLDAIRASVGSRKDLIKRPVNPWRFRKPVALAVLGAIILGTTLYVTLPRLRSKSGVNAPPPISSGSTTEINPGFETAGSRCHGELRSRVITFCACKSRQINTRMVQVIPNPDSHLPDMRCC